MLALDASLWVAVLAQCFESGSAGVNCSRWGPGGASRMGTVNVRAGHGRSLYSWFLAAACYSCEGTGGGQPTSWVVDCALGQFLSLPGSAWFQVAAGLHVVSLYRDRALMRAGCAMCARWGKPQVAAEAFFAWRLGTDSGRPVLPEQYVFLLSVKYYCQSVARVFGQLSCSSGLLDQPTGNNM